MREYVIKKKKNELAVICEFLSLVKLGFNVCSIFIFEILRHFPNEKKILKRKLIFFLGGGGIQIKTNSLKLKFLVEICTKHFDINHLVHWYYAIVWRSMLLCCVD